MPSYRKIINLHNREPTRPGLDPALITAYTRELKKSMLADTSKDGFLPCTSCDGLGYLNRQIFNKDGTTTIMKDRDCLLCMGKGHR